MPVSLSLEGECAYWQRPTSTSQRLLRFLLLLGIFSNTAATAAAQTDTFIAGSGLWSMGSNWSLTQPPGQSNDCVIPANSNVTDDTHGVCQDYTQSSGSVVTLPVNTSAELDVYGPSFVNQGTLNLDAANGLAFLAAGTQTLSGGGTINLVSNRISATGPLVNTNNSIHGQTGIFFGQLTNQSLIDANMPSATLTVQGGVGLINTGTLQASNGGILLLSAAGTVPLTNTGGTIQALTGSTVQTAGYTFTGGTLTTSGTGVFQDVNVSTFKDLTNSGNFQSINGSYAILEGTITNNGTITASSGTIYANGKVTLKGSGSVTGGGAFIHSFTSPSSINIQQPVSGGGSVGDTGLSLTNQSTITANNPSSNLTFNGNPEVNTGTMEATSGATLEIQNTVNNAGGTITAQDGSTVLLDFAGTIAGGNVTTTGTGVVESVSGTLDGSTNAPTNSGTMTVPAGDTLNVKGTINNNGTISLGPNGGFLALAGSTTLAGSGELAMNPSSAVLSGGNYILTNQSNISGAGNMGNGEVGVVNAGIITANQSTALVINPDSSGFTNTGTLVVNAGSTLNIEGTFNTFSNSTLTAGTYTLGGTLEFQNANIKTNSAKLTLTGSSAVILNSTSNTNGLASFASNTSKGVLSLQSGAAVTTKVNFNNKGTVTVGTGSSFTVGGTYTQTGGTTTVDGTLTALAAFSLQKGKLFGSGIIAAALTAGASVTAGDSATKTAVLTVSSYTENSAGTLNISIGGTTVGTNYGQLASSNGVSLGGTLSIKLINHFVPAIGETFTLLTGGSVTGQFATVKGLSINSSEHFEINYTPTAVTVSVVSGP